jgi:PHP domain
MKETIHGTFHFHSTYSHDGRSTLSEIASALSTAGLAFCVLTEHFEDFSAPKFNEYLRETREVTEKSGVLLVPGIEMNLSGLDTILFPVREYDEVAKFASDGTDSGHRLCKVVAHASKYPFEDVVKHLQKYQIEGVEIWNQQADGSHIPPFKLLDVWQTYSGRRQHRYFFGCDLHKANLAVANIISLSVPSPTGANAIIQHLREGNFVSRNLPTGVEYRNGAASSDFDAWLQRLREKSYYRGRILGTVRSSLKSVYKMLPRDTQRSLNDVKNFVRNKV